jgi:thioesterase domain-containing protein
MRMAADLRRQHGIRLDVGAFLADPTFANFSALSRAKPITRPEGYVLVGPADFERVMLLVPGSGGHAAALYALADELQRGLPPASAVAIVDLDAALYSAPHDDPLWFVSQRIVQVARDLGDKRVMGIVGFSLGGALALRVADELGIAPAPPVWMLDTFAPRIAETGFWRKVERRLAWWLFGGRPEKVDPSTALAPLHHALPLSATPAQWNALNEQLTEGTLAVPTAQVRLIQARRSVMHGGLLWQRRNNGFVPRDYASWGVHEIDGAHLDLPRHLAATTARIIVDQWHFGQFGVSGTA